MSHFSKEFEKFEKEREHLQRETNSSVVEPFDGSIFSKTKVEKEILKSVRSSHKQHLKIHYGKNYKKQLNIS